MANNGNWWDVTRNPVFGCTKCSPGCDNCYAEKMAKRLKGMGQKNYQLVAGENGWTGWVNFDPDLLKKPIPGRGKRVFVCNMSDLFHGQLSYRRMLEVLEWARSQKAHRFVFCTKRANNMAAFFRWYNGFRPQIDWAREKHIMGMVTACNQEEADEKIPLLLQCPWASRGVSLEPLLGPIEYNFHGLDWVIVGAESGPKRRYCDVGRVRSVVSQCRAAKVPVFVKQLHRPDHRFVKDITEFPFDLMIRQYPAAPAAGGK